MNQSQSMMDRANARQIASQRQSDFHDEVQAKLPLLVAQSQLETEKARAALHNGLITTDLERRAATESVGFNKEFQDAMSWADWNTRADALGALQPRIAYMAQLPEYKGFVTAVENQRLRAVQASIQDAKLEELQQVASDNRAARADVAEQNRLGRVESEQVKGGYGVEKAKIYSGGRESVQEMRNQGAENVQKLRGEQQANRPADTIHRLVDLAFEADQNASEASQHGDKAAEEAFLKVAQSYRDAVAKQSTHAGFSGGAPATAAPPARPAALGAKPAPVGVSVSIPGSGLPPSGGDGEVAADAPAVAQPSAAAAAPAKEVVAPQTFSPKDVTVVNGIQTLKVGDKTLPLHKDAKGNLAYKLNGVWHEVRPSKPE